MPDPRTRPYLVCDYEVSLPVFKQGDDFAQHLGEAEDVPAAFEALAARYRDAAATCLLLAEMAREVPEAQAHGDTHHIGVRGPVDQLGPYEGTLLRACEFPDDDEATETALVEQLHDAMDGRGPFSLSQALEGVGEMDAGLRGLNPEWVRAVLDREVAEGSLLRVGDDTYEVAPEEIAS